MKLLSLCMIVKNEEKLLSRCLESVKTLVDEIIIVDTGSTDQTKAIAQEYTEHVYDFIWINDFAAARNESLKYATGKWILILDADEYIEQYNHEELRKLLSSRPEQKPEVFLLNILNLLGDGYDETQVLKSQGARLFANNGLIYYRQPLHEQLTCDNEELTLQSLSFTIYHTGYTSSVVSEKEKSARNMAILEQMKPDQESDPYYQFVLGNEHKSLDQKQTAMQCYYRSYEKSRPTDAWYHYLLTSLISLELQTSNFEQAHTHIKQGLSAAPDSVDYHCLNGLLLEELGFLNNAAEHYLTCIHLTEKAAASGQSSHVLESSYEKIIPYQRLAEIARQQSRLEDAVSHWSNTLINQPKNFSVLQHYMDHLTLYMEPESIVNQLNKLYPVHQPLHIWLLHNIALKAGNLAVSVFYNQLLIQQHLQINATDSLLFTMLSRSASCPDMTEIRSSIPVSVSAMADIIYHNATPEALSQQEPLKDTLLYLLKYGYSDHYYALLETVENAETINNLAAAVSRIGRTDETVELLELLLQHQALNASSLQLLGQLHVNIGDSETAFQCWVQAYQLEHSPLFIGLIRENCSPENVQILNTEIIDSSHHWLGII